SPSSEALDVGVAPVVLVPVRQEAVNPSRAPLASFLGLCHGFCELVTLLFQSLQQLLVDLALPAGSAVLDLHPHRLKTVSHLLGGVDVLRAELRGNLSPALFICLETLGKTLGVLDIKEQAVALHVRADLGNLVLEPDQFPRNRRDQG